MGNICNKGTGSFRNVNECPDDKHLNKYVRGKVCAAGVNKWRDLGIVLMGQDAVTDLDVIRINHPNDVEECCSRMFTKWRQRTPTASWKQLIEALKEVKLTQLASELEELLIPSIEYCIEQESKISQQLDRQQIPSEVVTSTDDVAACEKLTNIRHIEVQFAKMTNRIKEALISDNVDVGSLIEQLCTISAVKNKNVPLFDKDVFKNIKSIHDFWRELRFFLNIFDYEFLQIVIEISGCRGAQMILEDFLSRIDPSAIEDADLVLYCKEEYREGSLKPELRIKVKSGKCTPKIKSMVEEIVSKTYKLKKYALQFQSIKEGCGELLYYISKPLEMYLLQFELSRKTILEEFLAHKIISLHIDIFELINTTHETFELSVNPKEDTTVTDLQKCKDDLKHHYGKRMNQKKSTRWPKLGDPTLYVDITIVRAKCLSNRFREEYAMGLVIGGDLSYVTVDELLKDGHGKVILIEGDPGSGKTTFTLQICKEWAKDKLLMEDIVLWIPLRHYKSVTTTSQLFDKLGYPEMMEYAQKRRGKGFVLILDGWDELPNHLQTASLFRDIIFGTVKTFTQSTIIVTSRPSCSGEIAEAVEETNSYYQILGFDHERAITYINAYFHNDSSSPELLLAFLNSNECLYRHSNERLHRYFFYIPISVAILCFVYRSDHEQIPQSLSRLYERFVMLCLHSNIPNTSLQNLTNFKTIHNIPGTIKPAFHRLCKIAFDMLKDNNLVLNEEELEVIQEELDNMQLEQFDGFGLLHVDHYTTAVATMETSCSFIHKAVQELLAAIFILDTGNISDILDEHFYEDSYLMNVFPFLFDLVSKELLRPLAGKLIQIFNKSDRLLTSILYCLFEAHDETLCHEFGQVFSEKRRINVHLHTLLNCHNACYFIAVCGVKRLNVSISCYINSDLCCEIFARYLQNASTDIAFFYFAALGSIFSHKGIEHFGKALSTQPNILSVKLLIGTEPGCVSILCNNICKHNTQITNLRLSIHNLIERDFESIGSLLSTLSLETLHLSSYSGGVCLDSLLLFCKALCETKSLHDLYFQMTLSQANSKVFGDIISQNCSLKTLFVDVATADCLDPILNGLSSNTSITTFRTWLIKVGTSNTLGQCLEKCLILNCTLNTIDFTPYFAPIFYVSWSCTQVCSTCTGLCANTTVVTLDISGCYIDTEACHAVCGMLSQNTTLQHLFLNPVQLDKQEAITMIESCGDNDTLELLSLVQWPPKILSDYHRGIKKIIDDKKNPFQYSCDPEINDVLLKIQKLRQERDKPLLNVYWKYDEYSRFKEHTF